MPIAQRLLSWSFVSTTIFIVYMFYTVYSFLSLIHPPTACKEGKLCLQYYLNPPSPKLKLTMFTSAPWNPNSNEVNLVMTENRFEFGSPLERSFEINVPRATRNNGTLHAHLFVSTRNAPNTWNGLVQDTDSIHISIPLTKYKIPNSNKFQLLEDNVNKPISQPVSHLTKLLPISMLTENITLKRTAIPADLYPFLRVTKSNKFLPILVHNALLDTWSNFLPLNSTVRKTTLTVKYNPIGYGALRFMLQMSAACETMTRFGFKDKELDDIKSMLHGTNLYIFLGTVVVSFIHLLFDFLAFKSDINFWRSRRNMEGVSAHTTVWRAFSQSVIFLYLMDEKSSLLVIIPTFVGAVIEFWKVLKVKQVDWTSLRWVQRDLSLREQETQEFDSMCMKYLSYLLYPLCICGAIYSLVYEEHSGWYSWLLSNLVNGVYVFGFLFMLPQLFINYKLKSVAHLPFKTFMYKAFNTFIDDVFAFVITMPTAHRLACFRDDIVFVAYMYQRWLYPVDRTRVDGDTSVVERVTEGVDETAPEGVDETAPEGVAERAPETVVTAVRRRR